MHIMRDFQLHSALLPYHGKIEHESCPLCLVQKVTYCLIFLFFLLSGAAGGLIAGVVLSNMLGGGGSNHRGCRRHC